MKVQELLTQDGKKYIVLDDDYQVIEPIKMYLKKKDREGCEANTLRSYAYHLKTYCEFLKQFGMEITDINTDDDKNVVRVFTAFIYWLRYGVLETESVINTNPVRDNKTINTILGITLEFYKTLAAAGMINDIDVYRGRRQYQQYKKFLSEINKKNSMTSNLFKMRTETRQKKPNTISREEFNKIVEAAGCLRDKILLAFMYEGGMRIGEALGVRVSDVKFRQCRVDIVDRRDNIGDSKVKQFDEGQAFLPNYVFGWIRKYVLEDIADYDSDYLFLTLKGDSAGKPMSYKNAYDMVTRLGRKTGIGYITPHTLRHGYARARREAGWDILDIKNGLRHKQIQTTTAYLDDKDEISVNKTAEFYRKMGIEIGGTFI